MKVKDFIKWVEKQSKEYPDIMEWDLYTEQNDLFVPENYRTIDEEIEDQKVTSEKYKIPFNQEYIDYLKECEKKITELKESGWKFICDSEGWVYKDTAGNEDFMTSTLFPKDKIITINNNY